MKKQFSKVIAASLTCAMLLPSAVFASTAGAPTLSGNVPDNTVSGDTTISGDSVVNTAIYNVILPSDLDFAVDKFEIAGKEQIYGEDYPIINASAFPVRVDLSVSSTSLSGQLVSENDARLTEKDAGKYFYLTTIVPEEVNVATVSAGDVAAGTISSNSTSANSVFPVATGAPAELAFALDGLADPATDTLSTNNAATFTFGGKVNPYEDWKDKDLSLETAFTLIGLSRDGYTAADPDAKNNMIGSVAAPEFPASVNRTANSPVIINFTPNSITGITKIEMVNAGTTFNALESGGTVDLDAGTITIPWSFMQYFTATTNATITYTTSGGGTSTAVVSVVV